MEFITDLPHWVPVTRLYRHEPTGRHIAVSVLDFWDAEGTEVFLCDADGVAIIAHPAGRAGLLPKRIVDGMLDAGLAGFELGHRENVEPALGELRRLVAERDLIVTGSSDYHGLGKPNQPGEHTTSDEMVARIIAAGTGSAPVHP